MFSWLLYFSLKSFRFSCIRLLFVLTSIYSLCFFVWIYIRIYSCPSGCCCFFHFSFYFLVFNVSENVLIRTQSTCSYFTFVFFLCLLFLSELNVPLIYFPVVFVYVCDCVRVKFVYMYMYIYTDKMKRSFFQATVASILLHGCTTWSLTKRLEKLDGNCTRMLRAILNKFWRQHPTRHQLYGHLSPITKTIQIRRTRHAGHCWRSRDELISDVLLWTPTHGRAKAGRPARTYIQQLCENTGCSPEDLQEAMNDRKKWRERVRDIRATSTTWWWWGYIYIYVYIYMIINGGIDISS